MNNVDEIRDVTYKPELLTIVEYIACSNCYRAKAFQGSKLADDDYYLQQIGGTAPFINSQKNSIHIPSISNNLEDGPQVTYIYPPQTAVMALIPVIANNNPVLDYMGFIIGPISTPVFYNGIKPENTDEGKFNAENVYSIINSINQTTPAIDLRANLDSTNLPGDLVFKGKHTKLCIDNISVTVGTDLAYTYYSSITGEKINVSMLNQDKTIWSDDCTYVIGDGILNVKRYTDNPYDAGLDLDDENTAAYTFTEIFGKCVQGKYFTVDTYTDKARYTVFQEYMQNNGNYSLCTATGLKIGKTHKFDNVSCSGAKFKPQVDDTVIIDKADLSQRTTYKTTKKSEPYAEDYEKTTITDKDENVINIYQGDSYIDFREDGSLKITDAWGSYILMSHGNIQIHAANNLFVVSDRDAIHITGGVESHRAVADIQMESVTSDIKLYAKELIQTGSKSFNIVSTDTVFKSNTITCLAPYIQCSTLDGEAGSIILGDILGNKSAIDIYVNSNNTIIKSDKSIVLASAGNVASLTSDKLCIGKSLIVGGDLSVDAVNINIKVNDININSTGSGGNIKVKNGSIYCGANIEAFNGIKAGIITATQVGAVKSNDGKLAKAHNLNLQTIKNKLNSDMLSEVDQVLNIGAPLDKDVIDSTYSKFTFNKESESCVFVMEDKDIKDSGVTCSVNKTEAGDSLYIYPGQSFWESNGIEIRTYTKDGISITSEGFISYLFNEHNMIRKD
jgi:hypothetical protein